jgi:hypothetical protein
MQQPCANRKAQQHQLINVPTCQRAVELVRRA